MIVSIKLSTCYPLILSPILTSEKIELYSAVIAQKIMYNDINHIPVYTNMCIVKKLYVKNVYIVAVDVANILFLISQYTCAWPE